MIFPDTVTLHAPATLDAYGRPVAGSESSETLDALIRHQNKAVWTGVGVEYSRRTTVLMESDAVVTPGAEMTFADSDGTERKRIVKSSRLITVSGEPWAVEVDFE